MVWSYSMLSASILPLVPLDHPLYLRIEALEKSRSDAQGIDLYLAL